MKQGIYDHFHPDEKPFVDRAMEWIERSAQQHELKRTDFLDPRQAQIVTMLANRNPDVSIRLDGGYSQAERKRAVVGPDYRSLDNEEIGISVLAVNGIGQARLELDHGDFLGALLGLGIKRDRIGDIHVHDQFCHIVVIDEIADYLNIHLRQVHRMNVLTDVLPLAELQTVIPKLEEMSLSVASMRLDGIASDVYRISRSKIVDPIRAGRCRVNWKSEEDPSEQLREGDVVSFKGLGRFKVIEVDGVTKKGRIRVKIGKFI
ncbi:YlmH/Sll1252 family protein [Paenibacillus alkaliterrae]|uniref:YlmH family RNA-binding protein n=1 Tax=Paenibacillus alkaliterrae TaxID=320909 RepID=UPI001F2238ED|nr:YlmH/Sll1252 family protein [Paenibacillus alkaliterrae]MCF2939301.1 YlmH/Sll1252 family protein [Paenibacillus alkaliterrae]